MYFVMLGATPKPSNERYGVAGDAYATCWVATDDPVAAESGTRSLLEDISCDVTEVEEAYPITRDRYAEGSVALERFDQASVDEVVLTLHTWPVATPDDDQESDVDRAV